jgi:hypothetical protein
MAAAPTPYATAESAVYELVARGNKDLYFYSDKKDGLFIFDNRYQPQAPFTSEIRRVPPHTACEFGRTVQFEFDLVGDIMTHPTLIINLPTWLPPPVAATNSKTLVSDASGVTYGYTKGIAYFLFENIEFYQDNILLQEFSGDALWAVTQSEGSYASTRVTNVLTNQHSGSDISIGKAATPGQLRLELPILGCQKNSDTGFPQRSVLSHSYRLRCKVRKLEDLVESSDGRMKPQPWERTDFQQITSRDAEPIPFNTLTRREIAPLNLQLETRQVYIPRELQDMIQKIPQHIQFKRYYENIFTQNQLDYSNVVGGGTSLIKRLLDGRHPAERIIWFFRSIADINANRLWKIDTGIPGSKSYFNNVNFQVAGKDRELPRSPFIWRDITNFAKEEIDTQNEMNSMNWGLGSIAPKRFPGHEAQTTGSVNFTTADRPTFYINLTQPPIDPQTGAPNTQLYVIIQGWAQFDTDGKGRAELFNAN